MRWTYGCRSLKDGGFSWDDRSAKLIIRCIFQTKVSPEPMYLLRVNALILESKKRSENSLYPEERIKDYIDWLDTTPDAQ